MAYTDREDLNYIGIFYLIGQNQTPFLNMMGGLNGGKRSTRFQFPVNQNSSLSSASQNVTNETAAASAGTATTYTRSQVYNVAQIMKYDVAVTYAKEAASGEFSGLNVTAGSNEVITSEYDWQKEMSMRQMAIDTEYSFIQGTFTDSSLASTDMATRGILEAVSSNAVAAGSTDLSKDLIDELLRTMADAGSQFRNPVFLAPAIQKQRISDIYGFAPQSRNVGGLNIDVVETDFARCGVVYVPQMPAAQLALVDMAYCNPVFVPFKSKNDGNTYIMKFEDEYLNGAITGGFWYTQIGLDYGHEIYHGKITGLTTS